MGFNGIDYEQLACPIQCSGNTTEDQVIGRLRAIERHRVTWKRMSGLDGWMVRLLMDVYGDVVDPCDLERVRSRLRKGRDSRKIKRCMYRGGCLWTLLGRISGEDPFDVLTRNELGHWIEIAMNQVDAALIAFSETDPRERRDIDRHANRQSSMDNGGIPRARATGGQQ